MTFAEPRMLWATLALVPALIAFLWWAWRRKQQLVTQFIQARLLSTLTVGFSKARQKARLALLVAAVGSLMLALARPQWGMAWEEAKQRGLDVVVAIDTSRSMLATDIAPNRLARAKLAALDLLREAKTDRLGLVAFAGTAFLQCPLTLDEEAFRQSVNALDVDIIPQGGSALMEAVNTARTAFNTEGDNHKILILFTDGEDHESGAVEAAQEAAKNGMRIFTVGIGTAAGELLRQSGEDGKKDFIRDEEGNVVKSRLNETLLREMATVGNGFYLPLRGANTMDVLYERGLAPLPKADISAKFIQRFHERFQWPLALGILLLMVEMLLPDRRRVPGSRLPVPSFRLPTRAGFAALLLAGLPLSTLGSPSGALRKFEKGDYDAARQEYERLLERSPDDARLHYNAGAAAYRAGQFEEASKSFDAALKAQDVQLQQRAYYNLGNSLYRRGEPLAEPQQKLETWEKSAQSFESALKLQPQDVDAKYNLDVVRKKLEELKKQQQQQPQSSKDNQDKKNEQDQKQQDQKDQQKKDDTKKSDQEKQQQQPSQSKQDQQKQQSQPKPDPGKEKQEQAGKKQEDPKKKEDAKNAQDGKDQGEDKDKGAQQQAAAALGQMSLQQAKQLLDAQKGEVRALIFKPPEDATKARSRSMKNW